MKITELYNEDALEMLADIIEPAAKIMSDTQIKVLYRTDRLKLVKHIIKEHKKSIIEILAALDGVPVKDYKANIVSMMKDILYIVNNDELMEVFYSQGQETDESAFGSAMENTEADAE